MITSSSASAFLLQTFHVAYASLNDTKSFDVKMQIFNLEVPIKAVKMGLMAIRKQHNPVLEAERTQLQPPRLYKVVLLNDDFTPMDFVIAVLERFFAMNREQATRVMLQVHHEGKGICGAFPRDIAATKVEQVGSFARQHQHPLACIMEEE